MMAYSKNVIYGISIASAWCILMCCSQLHTSGDISNPGWRNMYFKFGDSSESYVAQTVNGGGSGNTFITYGDCSASNVTTNVYSYGSGDIYIMYGYSCALSTCVPCKTDFGEEWAKNMNTQGSGDLCIQYGSCSSSSASAMDHNVTNGASGVIRVLYGNYNPSKVAHKIYSGGSGNVFIMYADCDSNVQRNANNDEILAHNVHTLGSGRVFITYGKQEGITSSEARNASTGNCEVIEGERRGRKIGVAEANKCFVCCTKT